VIRLCTGPTGFHVALDMCHAGRCVFCFGDVCGIRVLGLVWRVGVLVGSVEVNPSSRYRVHSPMLVAVVFWPWFLRHSACVLRPIGRAEAVYEECSFMSAWSTRGVGSIQHDLRPRHSCHCSFIHRQANISTYLVASLDVSGDSDNHENDEANCG